MEENKTMETNNEVEAIYVDSNESYNVRPIETQQDIVPVMDEDDSKIGFGTVAVIAAAITGVAAASVWGFKKIKRFRDVYKMGLEAERELAEESDYCEIDYDEQPEIVETVENSDVKEFVDKRKEEKKEGK